MPPKRLSRAKAVAAVRKVANHLSQYKLELDHDCIVLTGLELEPEARALSAELGHCKVNHSKGVWYVWYNDPEAR